MSAPPGAGRAHGHLHSAVHRLRAARGADSPRTAAAPRLPPAAPPHCAQRLRALQLRGFASKEECPILHASTYEAWAYVPPVPVEGGGVDAEAAAAAERKRIGARPSGPARVLRCGRCPRHPVGSAPARARRTAGVAQGPDAAPNPHP